MKNTALKKTRINRTTPLHPATSGAVLIFLLAAINPSFAADDDYLRSLESESNNSRSATTNPSGTGNNYLDALSDEAESSSKVSTGAQHDEAYFREMKNMEELLKNKKPSTYKFYKKLNPKKQARIFEHYMADNSDSDTRLSHLKKQVMDTYFKR